MEIISRSNQGFRTRPSFQKIASKPNKQINYVVNPNQAVRDSYEFSNLINGEIDVEDEIKKQIADEIVHNEIQKEIARRQVLEKEKEQRTAAGLRGTIPTTLPEMSGAAATRPEFFDIATETTSPAYQDTTVDEEEPPQIYVVIYPLLYQRWLHNNGLNQIFWIYHLIMKYRPKLWK